LPDIAGAGKKLRQALFFLGHLEQASKDTRGDRRDPEHLEFYFSACLSAAKSIYYVLDKTGDATFREVQKRWRGELPEPQRSWFGRMMGLRDNDVHVASSGAEPLPKYVKEEDWSRSAYYTYFSSSAALFGSAPDVEMENPDGTKVSGPVLRGALGLYLKQQGRLIEATEACREFLRQMESLVEEMKTACGR